MKKTIFLLTAALICGTTQQVYAADDDFEDGLGAGDLFADEENATVQNSKQEQ